MLLGLQKKIVQDYPELCRDFGGDPRHTCMAWGFEVGNGWHLLLRAALSQLNELRPQVVLDQVKEKYGTIRIYYHGGPPIVPKWWKRVLWLPAWAYWTAWRCVRAHYAGYDNVKQCIIFTRWRKGYWSNFWSAVRAQHGSWLLTGGHDAAEEIVREAEEASLHTCEVCGMPGQINDGGWLSVRCEKCRKEGA